MTTEFLQPPGWTAPKGYSNGVSTRGRQIYLAGQIGWNESQQLVSSRFAAQVRQALPQAWWIGVGISFSFIAEHVKRAPVLTQRLGLEWTHRLIQEPRRLFRRYVIEDLPFAFLLLGRCALERLRGM